MTTSESTRAKVQRQINAGKTMKQIMRDTKANKGTVRSYFYKLKPTSYKPAVGNHLAQKLEETAKLINTRTMAMNSAVRENTIVDITKTTLIAKIVADTKLTDTEKLTFVSFVNTNL